MMLFVPHLYLTPLFFVTVAFPRYLHLYVFVFAFLPTKPLFIKEWVRDGWGTVFTPDIGTLKLVTILFLKLKSMFLPVGLSEVC